MKLPEGQLVPGIHRLILADTVRACEIALFQQENHPAADARRLGGTNTTLHGATGPPCAWRPNGLPISERRVAVAPRAKEHQRRSGYGAVRGSATRGTRI